MHHASRRRTMAIRPCSARSTDQLSAPENPSDGIIADHSAQSPDCRRLRRLHRHADLGALVHADAGAIHTPDRRTEGRGPEPPVAGHKTRTKTESGRRGLDDRFGNSRFAERCWWTARGSNSRPPRCERGALPAELAAHDLPSLAWASSLSETDSAASRRHPPVPLRSLDSVINAYSD